MTPRAASGPQPCPRRPLVPGAGGNEEALSRVWGYNARHGSGFSRPGRQPVGSFRLAAFLFNQPERKLDK